MHTHELDTASHDRTIAIYGGRFTTVLNPSPQHVNWRGIAVSLGRKARLNGNTTAFYSVAQHCVQATRLVAAALRSPAATLCLTSAMPKEQVEAALEVLARARMDDEMAIQLQLAELIHDAHEAHLGDMLRPVEDTINSITDQHLIADIKYRHDCAIYTAAGLPWPLPIGFAAIIAAADDVMLATERRDLMCDGGGWGPLPRPASMVIKPAAESLATNQFLTALSGLGVKL